MPVESWLQVVKAMELAKAVSPTAREEEAFDLLLKDLKAHHESHKTILVNLIGAIFDGLQYGNWPH